MPQRTYYHVTERQDAPDILEQGFIPGWGDTGLGVYLYGTLTSALGYAAAGGWDGALQDPVILAVEAGDVGPVLPHADWPAAKYADMFWKDMDDLDEESRWTPARVTLVETPVPPVRSRPAR